MLRMRKGYILFFAVQECINTHPILPKRVFKGKGAFFPYRRKVSTFAEEKGILGKNHQGFS